MGIMIIMLTYLLEFHYFTRFPGFVQGYQEYHRKLADRYHRFFVAEVGGERAGMIKLGHLEDKYVMLGSGPLLTGWRLWIFGEGGRGQKKLDS